jgi:hypothetical protein
MIVSGIVEPMELAHLPYWKGKTYEDYLRMRGLERIGKEEMAPLRHLHCDNLIFHRRAALDALGERLLDANRSIGQPNKITVIFGRKITQPYRGKLANCTRGSRPT